MADHNGTYTTQFLRVIGRLYPDLRLRLRPGYLSAQPRRIDREIDSPLTAELIDESGAPIGAFPLRLLAGCSGDAGSQTLAVRGWVPFHPRTRRVRYVYKGRVLREDRRSERGPEIAFTWEPPERMEGEQRVTWSVEHPEGLPVQCFLRYSPDGGQTWTRIGMRTEQGEQTVNFDQLPGGENCQLAVVATDGINTQVMESRPFQVVVKPCIAMILGPLDGAHLPADQAVRLEGQGWWLEEARAEREALHWASSIDGELGAGAQVEAHLSPGRHTLHLTAGRGRRQGQAQVSITVGADGSGTGSGGKGSAA
jgi:hypothetical protein